MQKIKPSRTARHGCIFFALVAVLMLCLYCYHPVTTTLVSLFFFMGASLFYEGISYICLAIEANKTTDQPSTERRQHRGN